MTVGTSRFYISGTNEIDCPRSFHQGRVNPCTAGLHAQFCLTFLPRLLPLGTFGGLKGIQFKAPHFPKRLLSQDRRRPGKHRVWSGTRLNLMRFFLLIAGGGVLMLCGVLVLRFREGWLWFPGSTRACFSHTRRPAIDCLWTSRRSSTGRTIVSALSSSDQLALNLGFRSMLRQRCCQSFSACGHFLYVIGVRPCLSALVHIGTAIVSNRCP